MQLVNILAEDKNLITYRPKLNKITGSVLSTILLQQAISLFNKNNNKPFFKFKEPCNHKLYKKGDSWCEELGFTKNEFDRALAKIGQKLKKGVNKNNDVFIYYWTTQSRETYYSVNIEKIEML
jgi:hypothetical protein